MTYAVDVNPLVYAADTFSPFHERARAALASIYGGADVVYLFWPVALGFLRITTRLRSSPGALTPTVAIEAISNLLALPNVRTGAEGPGFWPELLDITNSLVVRGKLFPDAHLVALTSNCQLVWWTRRKHPTRGYRWRRQRYWQREKACSRFGNGEHKLKAYADTKIHRHTKVQGIRSPFDGDWLYWGTRLGKDPTKPDRETALLKVQQGRCMFCGGLFVASDMIEVHHKDRNRNNNVRQNLELLHAHCHDQLHATDPSERCGCQPLLH